MHISINSVSRKNWLEKGRDGDRERQKEWQGLRWWARHGE